MQAILNQLMFIKMSIQKLYGMTVLDELEFDQLQTQATQLSEMNASKLAMYQTFEFDWNMQEKTGSIKTSRTAVSYL